MKCLNNSYVYIWKESFRKIHSNFIDVKNTKYTHRNSIVHTKNYEIKHLHVESYIKQRIIILCSSILRNKMDKKHEAWHIDFSFLILQAIFKDSW